MVTALKTKVETEIDPFKEYRNAPTLALRNHLVKLNLGLARKVAYEISSHSFESYEDLRQLADMVLVDCVEKFDPSKGFRFSTFAIPKLRGRLLNYLRDKGHTIRVPRKYYDTIQKAKRAERSFVKIEGRHPSPREIAAHAKISFELYLASRHAFVGCRFFHTVSACVDHGITDTAEKDLDLSLERLERLEKAAVAKFFYSKLSLEQVAADMEISQPELKEILRSAIKKAKVSYAA
ncbi:SIG3.3.2, RNA polymerase sigma-B factor [Nostoc flagelliforme CCNUN1]|uniref:SIG3.3.2, RNA polymerase sigma-B factor n=1 Tax=Nostoc flagelliforme CCNUN1 TaxID=2038116 RepID=A0A2K8SL54_9NOSO|nr:sigma-70 family RNA polymerase sigma factor [Nostoc flagelliforme]AUB36138.1 SIG3.3.2, RNA polymerase sigma-B factor [Nostoc flagelliforme CCNUN1]